MLETSLVAKWLYLFRLIQMNQMKYLPRSELIVFNIYVFCDKAIVTIYAKSA
jgi:hypothetical protein